jgi:hypothetical protein
MIGVLLQSGLAQWTTSSIYTEQIFSVENIEGISAMCCRAYLLSDSYKKSILQKASEISGLGSVKRE